MTYRRKGGEFLVNTTTQGAQDAPQIALLASGGYVIVWRDQSLGSRGQVFDADGNKVGGEFATEAWRVAALPGGGFVALWGDSQDVFARIHDSAGNAVGSSFQVNTTTGNQYPESVTALASGGFVITWADISTLGNIDVRGQRFGANGTRLGAEFVVNADAVGTGYQLNSEVKGLAGGGFVVAWESEGNIKAQLFTAAGARTGGEFRVNGSTGKMAVPQIAALASGGFVIVWTNDTQLSGPEPYRGIYARLFSAAGAPVGAENLVAPEGPQGFDSLDVASLATGGFVVTWATSYGASGDGSGTTVKAQVLDGLGNEVGGELIVNTTAHGDQVRPVATGLPSGDFVIGWMDGSESGGIGASLDIRSQLFQWAGSIEGSYQPKGEETIAHTTTQGIQEGPGTTTLTTGNYLVLWRDDALGQRGQVFDPDGNRVGAEFATESRQAAALPGGGFVALWGDSQDVFARIHDSSGAAVGPSFRVNTTTGNQIPDSVAALASGGFVITWADVSTLGHIDIRGQRFDSAGARLGSEFVVNQAAGTGYQLGSEVKGLAGGGFVVSWESEGNIKAQIFDSAGARTGGELRVNTSAGKMAVAQVVALASGGFAIVWTENTQLSARPEPYRGIYGQIFSANGDRVGTEILIAPEGPEQHVSLDAASLATGGFVVTWASRFGTGGDGSGTTVKAQVLDDLGNEIGGELVVNTTTRNDQIFPVVTGLASGDFVISWQDGSEIGGIVQSLDIRSQHFHLVAPIEGSYRGELLRGTALNDVIYGWGGDDDLRGLAGNDVLDGGDGDDVVRGGAGDDVLKVAGLGSDLAEGGSGFDTLVADFSDSWTNVISSWGPIANSGEGGFDGGFRDQGARWLNYTSIERFEIKGGLGDDQLVTASGDDRIDGGPGCDVMAGGAGDDSYIVDASGDRVDERPGEGTDEVRTGLAVYVLAANVENLMALTDDAHDFRGNAGDNEIVGAAGNDSFRLQDGGADTVVGGAGNDFFYFGAALTAADRADGGAGNDQLALQGNYSLNPGASITGIESLVLLPGDDSRFGDSAGNFYDYSLTASDLTVAAGARLTVDANRLRVGEDFKFNGAAESDGEFFLIGGKGKDSLTGGAKSDTFLFGENGQFGAGDFVDGGPGGSNDQLALRGNYTIVFGAGQLVSIESIALVSAQDTRFGALGAAYNYNLTMNDGNVAAGQTLTVDGAPLRPGETLVFNGAAETNGAFRVAGGAGADTITGGAGADILIGRGGADSLRGGAGADQFRYNEVADSTHAARDTIRDFTAGDLIDLSRIDAVSATTASNDAFHFIGSAAFTNTAGELRAVQSGADWTVQADTNGDGVADFEILVVTAGPAPLGAGDFIL